MARGARKSLQEKIAQKEELIEALTTRLKNEKEELNELVRSRKWKSWTNCVQPLKNQEWRYRTLSSMRRHK